MQFNEILQDLIIDNNISIQILSKESKIDDSILYDYLHGSFPSIKYAVILANYFNCSLSYLMGLDDNPQSFKFKTTYDMSVFSERYEKLLNQNNTTHFRVCKETMLNYSSHYIWLRGKPPKINSLMIIARYFNCSIDFLIGRSDKL